MRFFYYFEWNGGFLIMFNGIPYSVLWLILAILLGIIEASTLGLFTIWFAIGAVFAMFAAMLGAPLIVQMLVFIAISGVLLFFTKPIIKKFLYVKKEKTNADKVIGEKGIVIEKIDYKNSTGQVKVKGQVWTARANNEDDIEENEIVEVKEISGVKLIVKRVPNKTN